jgi:hypothetical protein
MPPEGAELEAALHEPMAGVDQPERGVDPPRTEVQVVGEASGTEPEPGRYQEHQYPGDDVDQTSSDPQPLENEKRPKEKNSIE